MNIDGDASAILNRLRVAQRTNAPQSQEIEALETWLVEHPRESVTAIRQIELDKYDWAVADVLRRIASPLADECSVQLVELLGDLNWPVYTNAADALLSFSRDALWSLAKECLQARRFEDLFNLAFELRRRSSEIRDELGRQLARWAHEFGIENDQEVRDVLEEFHEGDDGDG